MPITDYDRFAAQVPDSNTRKAMQTVVDAVEDLQAVVNGGSNIVIGTAAPNNGDGRPNDTIYIQVAS